MRHLHTVNGKDLCIDGHHRLFRAASIGQEWIPAYFLTPEQTESIKILTLPPEQGFDWGQRAKPVDPVFYLSALLTMRERFSYGLLARKETCACARAVAPLSRRAMIEAYAGTVPRRYRTLKGARKMPLTRHAAWRRASKPARNKPLPLHREVPPIEDEDLSSQEMAEIERMLEMMAGAECAMGCDYPDGPMSPSGCPWQQKKGLRKR